MQLTMEKKRGLFREMLRIRRVQERIEALYLEDDMQTPVHLCIGQEAVAAGVCAALRRDDYLSSNHRGHGHYLAKGGSLPALIAELHCRETGCSKGRGGSMHLVDCSVGHLGSSSIVGGGIPIGTGLALAAKMRAINRVSVVFFGDGAADEGTFYESLNFAVLKQLPIIYVLENNGYSVCSPVSARQACRSIFHRMDPQLLYSAAIDGNDVMLVLQAATHAVDRARKGLGPSLIECDTYRILGHAGCAAQDAKGYRPEAEVAHWRRRCPVASFKTVLGAEGILSEADIEEMEMEIQNEIDAAFAFAKTSRFPDGAELSSHLFKI